MNTTATRLTQVVMIAATVSAAFMSQAADTGVATAMPVITFPTVTVVGHREPVLAVVQMPRVMIIGHRNEAAPVMARKDDSASLPRARRV